MRSRAYARARMRLWTRYADEVATEAVKLPSFVKNIQPELQRMPREEALAAIERIPDAHVRKRRRCLGLLFAESRQL